MTVSLAVLLKEPKVAVRVAVLVVATPLVVTVKLTVFAPASTTTDAGPLAKAESEPRVTVTPPVGATAFRVTVPVEDRLPRTVTGERPTETNVGEATVSFAVLVMVPNFAEMVAMPVVATGWVVAVKVAVLDPAGTVTDTGTVANAESEVRFTTTPPVGAMPVRVTVPAELAPPTTEVGNTVTDERIGASMPSFADLVTPFRTAEMVAETFAFTAVVVTANVADDAPAGMVTEAGAPAAGLFDVSETERPPKGAIPLRVTVPVAPSPPNTKDGLRVRLVRTGGVLPRFWINETAPEVAVSLAVALEVTATVATVKVA